MTLGQATILVVDDEPDLREIFAAWLGRDAARVLTAANGVEALNVLDAEKIDVLLSDIRMPVMDGLTLVRTIYERGLNVPSIVFVSGYGDVGPREMYGLGVEALLEKPLRRAELLQHLGDILLEPEQRWLQSSMEPMFQAIHLRLPSLSASAGGSQFLFGRGGCCFTCDRPLTEHRTIDLTIDFVEDGLCLKAQGWVRWFDELTGSAGVQFSMLEPECREWVLKEIECGLSRSFIPHCFDCSSSPQPVKASREESRRDRCA